MSKLKKVFRRLSKIEHISLEEELHLVILQEEYIAGFNRLAMSAEARELLENNTLQFMNYTNGVGSEVGFVNRVLRWLIPAWVRNRLFGVDITPASDIHDVEYSLKIKFKSVASGETFKRIADFRFKKNMMDIINRVGKYTVLTLPRMWKARLYFAGVGLFGSNSFWKGKIKPRQA